MTDKPRSNAEARADDQARVGVEGVEGAGDAVETRAIGGRGTVVRNRRAEPDAQVPRAETRGIYRDPISGARRTVGAGQPIPDGWKRIESATVSDRSVDGGREAHASGATPVDSSGGATRSGRGKRTAS